MFTVIPQNEGDLSSTETGEDISISINMTSNKTGREFKQLIPPCNSYVMYKAWFIFSIGILIAIGTSIGACFMIIIGINNQPSDIDYTFLVFGCTIAYVCPLAVTLWWVLTQDLDRVWWVDPSNPLSPNNDGFLFIGFFGCTMGHGSIWLIASNAGLIACAPIIL